MKIKNMRKIIDELKSKCDMSYENWCIERLMKLKIRCKESCDAEALQAGINSLQITVDNR